MLTGIEEEIVDKLSMQGMFIFNLVHNEAGGAVF